ncbi:MAG: hypothetical protein O7C59_09960, partial [Rickettsia endosymbiont of Ixodes persulcatus]|nr:hypothetical protein [Rickettsia endosymbiont of Ixodes persulcatus]
MLKKDFFAYFPDLLLSEKFLAFASYSNESNQSEAEITLKIARDIYNDIEYSPIYYDLDHSPTSLNLFICSRNFNFLKR